MAVTVAIPSTESWTEARAVAATLRHAGHEAWFVGGCVRDLLLGRPVSDIDLATSALPAQIEACFPKTLDVGRNFGVIIVVRPSGRTFEIATFRSDAAYLDGRRPSAVSFATAAEDVQRRDFTLNALLLDPVTGAITDLVGGIADLAARRLRVVGDAARLAEDRLRVLRACRFAAQLDLTIDATTWEGVCATSVLGLARQRIWQEIGKALAHPRRVRWWDLLVASGKLHEVFPDLPGEPRAIADQLSRITPVDDDLLPLAVILAEVPEQALADWLGREPLPRAQVQRLRLLRQGADRLRASPPIPERRRWLRRPDGPLLVRLLTCRGEVPAAQEWLGAEIAAGELPTLLNAGDLLAMGHSQGPRLGQLLRQVEDAQLLGQLTDRNAALAWARERLAGRQ